MSMIKLAPNFSFKEMTYSVTAINEGITNKPNEEQYVQLVYLSHTMQKIRSLFGGSIKITSGFRCIDLNRKIGSKDNSYHTLGQACDFFVSNFSLREAYEIIKNSDVDFRTIILEFPDSENGWIHLDIYPFAAKGKKRFLRADKVNGLTVYKNVI